ncbi:MAG TPA: PilZ domain-containing protein [Thermoanaerobaculia bacterium]|jgi:hypothetical protein|nr:PilZ domain-containing protein [Thermoanaerobaculia bacterium]
MAILESPEDERKFPRLAAGIHVRFRGASLRKTEREYLEGVAENVSLGGMFIATPQPPREGSLITLEFDRPAVTGGRPVRAKALVCWRRRWRQPRGMGIRFVEFEGLGELPLAVWLEEVLAADLAGSESTTQVFPVFG